MPQFIGKKALRLKTGDERSDRQLRRDEAAGLFPKRIKPTFQNPRWVAAEIEKWMAEQIAKRDGKTPNGENI